MWVLSETKSSQSILSGLEVRILTAVLFRVSAVPSHALANWLVIGGVAEGMHTTAFVSASVLTSLADGIAVFVVGALVVVVATSDWSGRFAVSANIKAVPKLNRADTVATLVDD